MGRKVTGLIPHFEDMAAGLLNDYEKNPLPFRERISILEGSYIMQITGSYNNYLTMTNLLAPLGAGGSDSLVMHVYKSALQLNNYASRIAADSPLNYAKEAENMSIEFALQYDKTGKEEIVGEQKSLIDQWS